jgi:hypothetical protein
VRLDRPRRREDWKSDQQSAIADTVTGDVVFATANGDLKIVLPRKAQRKAYVIATSALGDHGGSAVDHCIPDLPYLLIVRIGGQQDAPRQLGAQGLKVLCVRIDHGRVPLGSWDGPPAQVRFNVK